jgi:hypothetical protein
MFQMKNLRLKLLLLQVADKAEAVAKEVQIFLKNLKK